MLRSLKRIPDEVAFLKIHHKITGIEGFLVAGQEKWLFLAARSLPEDANIVEIGAFKGKSTVSLALGCLGSQRRVFSIDTFVGSYDDVRDSELEGMFARDFFSDWQENMKRTGVSEHTTALQGHSQDIVKSWSKPIHLLFIDGSHQYEDVIADFDHFFPHVVERGIVSVHDVTPSWPGPYRAWHERFQYVLIETGCCGSLAYGVKAKGNEAK